MTIQQAIEKATEGGWDWRKDAPDPELSASEIRDMVPMFMYSYALLSTSFWQCLCKALGWDGKHYSQEPCVDGELLEVTSQGRHKCWDACSKGNWLYQWHRFIDHLASNRSIEDYFETL